MTARSVAGEGLAEIRGNFNYRGALHWSAAADTATEGAVLAGAYAACVAWVDSQVGRLLGYLDASTAHNRTAAR